MSESPDHLDYEWHVKLTDEEGERLHPDALTEMVRQQLKALLGCVVLTDAGVDLRVTGFRFLADMDAEQAIYPEVAKRGCAAVESPSRQQGGDVNTHCPPQDGGDRAAGR